MDVLPDSWSNWNLEMLVLEERGKLEYLEKNLSEQGREPTTNSTHIRCWCRDLNPGHIGRRRVLSSLCHPCTLSPCEITSIVPPTWLPCHMVANQLEESSIHETSFRKTHLWNIILLFLIGPHFYFTRLARTPMRQQIASISVGPINAVFPSLSP